MASSRTILAKLCTAVRTAALLPTLPLNSPVDTIPATDHSPCGKLSLATTTTETTEAPNTAGSTTESPAIVQDSIDWVIVAASDAHEVSKPTDPPASPNLPFEPQTDLKGDMATLEQQRKSLKSELKLIEKGIATDCSKAREKEILKKLLKVVREGTMKAEERLKEALEESEKLLESKKKDLEKAEEFDKMEDHQKAVDSPK